MPRKKGHRIDFETVKQTRLKVYREGKMFRDSGIREKQTYLRWYAITSYYTVLYLAGAYFSQIKLEFVPEETSSTMIENSDVFQNIRRQYTTLWRFFKYASSAGLCVSSADVTAVDNAFSEIDTYVSGLITQ